MKKEIESIGKTLIDRDHLQREWLKSSAESDPDGESQTPKSLLKRFTVYYNEHLIDKNEYGR